VITIGKEVLQATLQQLDHALHNHQKWLGEITRTIICRLPHDKRDLAEDAHRQCRFGQWCYDNPPEALREHPAFVAMAIEHHRMHQFARLLLLETAHDASGSPKSYDSFTNAVDRLRLEIDTLKRAIEETLYNRDTLTGAENRVRMLTKLREWHELVKRRAEQCGIAIMDLDHFKRINDTYGHPIGDQVLVDTVRYVTRHLRPYDGVFRYGGEEFLISLPNTDPKTARAVIERLRAGLAEVAGGLEGKTIGTTASFGIAELSPDVSVEESIGRADAALYAAKRSGRNCSCVWDPTMTTGGNDPPEGSAPDKGPTGVHH
jgi:diguanylate cyclase